MRKLILAAVAALAVTERRTRETRSIGGLTKATGPKIRGWF